MQSSDIIKSPKRTTHVLRDDYSNEIVHDYNAIIEDAIELNDVEIM